MEPDFTSAAIILFTFSLHYVMIDNLLTPHAMLHPKHRLNERTHSLTVEQEDTKHEAE
jgi:hypothetical protein